MSSLAPLTATATATGLPVVSEANEPAAVRNGSVAVKQAYASAQSFEEMLLQQLSQSLTQSSGLSGEEAGEGGGGGGGVGGEGSGAEGTSGAGGEAGGGMLSSLLPQTLTEGVMREGGLGLAGQLVGALDPSAAASTPTAIDPAGGVSAGPPVK
jgi:hypothetical protein